jgi:hypothetical protein
MMTRRIAIAALTLTLVGLAWRGSSATAQPTAHKTRIGVYDSRAVCVASRGMPFFSQQVRDLQKQLTDAKAANDNQRIEQIKQRGQSLQTLRHMQAFSKAPIDDILAQIKDQLPAIAKLANVTAIASTLDYTGPDVETVDVTDALVKAFHPDEKTLKTVAEVRKHTPIDPVEALEIRD